MVRTVFDCCLFERSLIGRNGRRESVMQQKKARPGGASLSLVANVMESRGAWRGAPRVTSLTLVSIPTAEIASSSPSAEATATTAGAGFLWLGFIDSQGTSVHL